MEIFLSVAVAAVVVAASAVLVASFYNFFKKFSALLLCSALLFGIIVYAFGYWDENYSISAFSVLTVALQSIFSSARFFIFDSDYSLLVNERVIHNIVYMFFFSVSAIYTMFAMTTTVLSLFASRALMSAKLYFKSAKKTYVFIGVSDEVLRLAFDAKANDKHATVVIIDKKSAFDSETYNKCYSSGVVLFNRHDRRSSTMFLPRAFFMRLVREKSKVHVIIASGGDGANADEAIDVLTHADISGKYAILTCRTDSEGRDAIFDELNATNWEIRLFSDKEIIVRNLIKNYPIIDCLDANGERCTVRKQPEILIAGSALDKELLLNIVRETQFDGIKPKVTVWSEKADVLSGALSIGMPELYKCADVVYITKNEFTADFYAFLSENEIDYAVFATPDYTANVKNADMYYLRTGRNVFAFVKDAKGVDCREDCGGSAPIFGRGADIYTYASIICDELHLSGRAVNMHYNNGIDDYYKKKIFDKKSNDAFGYNIPLKLSLLGLEITHLGDPDAMTSAEFKEFIAPRLDYLARQEHARWNAFYFTNGYCTWNLDDIPKSWNATKDSARRLHACLVAYDELDDVSERFSDKVKDVPYGYKGYDMTLVESIVEILNYCGLSAKPKQKNDNIDK